MPPTNTPSPEPTAVVVAPEAATEAADGPQVEAEQVDTDVEDLEASFDLILILEVASLDDDGGDYTLLVENGTQ